MKMDSPIRGYLEGYYGKLLRWSERHQIISTLSELGLNSYFYAPKEDVLHRLHWRTPYEQSWRLSFNSFCTHATQSGVAVLAGIAPGLDFNFDQFEPDSDFGHLVAKAKQLLSDGADHVVVLWDDIDDTFPKNLQKLTEGKAHATVVNLLSKELGQPIFTVPRVYARDIKNKNQYREEFFATLNVQNPVILCGDAIVVSDTSVEQLQALAQNKSHRVILWDNFYANDYCPRRLFVGPWTGRSKIDEYLLNPTGLPYTDQLLLTMASACHTSDNMHKAWEQTLKEFEVPTAFRALGDYFDTPVFGDRVELATIDITINTAEALEECLWKWKSPLAREWYPYLMSLKHDLALQSKSLPEDRIIKTQPAPLATTL
ncbi:MAG: beta-N-acetylglucosaminidase domain-containing protein, partial [Gammaproteobacteria bacterium]|nr:beta-N-acetylglucosaminidase domain-containing protein [Gammaproteobacteria bacterium]